MARKRKDDAEPLYGWLYRARDRDRWAVEIKPASESGESRQGKGMVLVGRIDLDHTTAEACQADPLLGLDIEGDMTFVAYMAVKYDQEEDLTAKKHRKRRK